MAEPLDDIEFLARSANRVTVLEAISAQPQTRTELEESTGVSKVTIGRIVEDFHERGWISRSDETFHTTRIGEAIATDFSQLQTTVGTAQKLRSIAPYLDALDLDIRHLENARITVPDSADPMAPFERPVTLLREASQARFLSRMVSPVVLDVIHDSIIEERLSLEAVMTPSVLERIRSDSGLATQTRVLLDSADVEAYLLDRPSDLEIAEIDETVAILVTDASDFPHAFIESTDETVRDWFDETFESYRKRAEPLTSGDIPGNPDLL